MRHRLLVNLIHQHGLLCETIAGPETMIVVDLRQTIVIGHHIRRDLRGIPATPLTGALLTTAPLREIFQEIFSQISTMNKHFRRLVPKFLPPQIPPQIPPKIRPQTPTPLIL